ncbi:metallophosphoesterase [Lentibacillus sp. N15]|uniref:metallophosphoesterase n=1 Tax=Lentibacillus songyuanensis TaxID=3136161 RepID=UPI0031BB6D5D
MKIAILSDIHEGINRKRTETDIMAILKRWIWKNKPEAFMISGDMANHPQKALQLLKALQDECAQTNIYFVHGNHDVYADNSADAYKMLLQFPGNLGNGPVMLNDDWVLIGDGGWYDYSHGLARYTEDDFAKGTYGTFTWTDKTQADWKTTDNEITSHAVQRLEKWLHTYKDKHIIMTTHFVPFSHFVQYKNDPSWDFFNAMMGSTRFGGLAVQYGVKKYIFGHIHTRYHEMYKGIEMIGNPLGYYPHEWLYDSPEKEIQTTIKTIII